MGLHLVLTTALAATAAVAPSPDCSWARPGADPYRGDPVAVLADFGLAEDDRARLHAMMQAHRPSDVVRITRDDIVGDDGSYEHMRAMHSGHGRVCRGEVDRSAWPAGHVERALVYCAGAACVMVPLACHNVALVTRRETPAREGRIDIEPAAGPPRAASTPPAPPTPDADAQGFLPWPPAADGFAPPGTDTRGDTPGGDTQPPGDDQLPLPGDGEPQPPGGGGPIGDMPGGGGGGGPGGPIVEPPPEGDCCIVIGNPPGGGIAPPAIPEAPAWTMLLVGWAWLLARLRRPPAQRSCDSGARSRKSFARATSASCVSLALRMHWARSAAAMRSHCARPSFRRLSASRRAWR